MNFRSSNSRYSSDHGEDDGLRVGVDAHAASVSDELRLVPSWAVALAALAFVAMQYFYWVVLPSHWHHPSHIPLGMRLYFAFSWSILAALYVLMVGYVTRDAPRRGMSTGIWSFICIVPGGIGVVLYFLLRQPVLSLCPSCGARVHSHFHFCPQCAFQISAICGNCLHNVAETDLYCVRCGHDLASDNTPTRLRAFRS